MTESIVPVVKGNVGKHIDVVVVRVGEGGKVQQVQLTLVPQVRRPPAEQAPHPTTNQRYCIDETH